MSVAVMLPGSCMGAFLSSLSGFAFGGVIQEIG